PDPLQDVRRLRHPARHVRHEVLHRPVLGQSRRGQLIRPEPLEDVHEHLPGPVVLAQQLLTPVHGPSALPRAGTRTPAVQSRLRPRVWPHVRPARPPRPRGGAAVAAPPPGPRPRNPSPPPIARGRVPPRGTAPLPERS